MAYYSAALAFTPAGAPALGGGRVRLGLELSYLPPLSAAQRSAGFSKPENTNLSSVLPRPRLAVALPYGFVAEASWVPPIEMFGAKANLVAGSLSRGLGVQRGTELTARAAVSGGVVTAPITCSSEMLENDGDALFFEHVCHGFESADRFEPFAVGVELLAARWARERWRPYAGIGLRHERNTFDVRVRDEHGEDWDPNHPILEQRATVPHAIVGTSWRASTRGSIGAELFYAPGRLTTMRVLVEVGRRWAARRGE
jgi:hypothetical protein